MYLMRSQAEPETELEEAVSLSMELASRTTGRGEGSNVLRQYGGLNGDITRLLAMVLVMKS